jgi:pyruvate kinase
LVQRMLIEKSVKVGKPVITATQMLESMITNPRPTRAEVNDVATAILLGTDSVMLSGESSAGSYPIEAVSFLTRIANEIEPNVEPRIIQERTGGPLTTEALTKAVAQMCIELDKEIDAVIVVSRTGRTARTIGRHGIKQPMYVFVSSEDYLRELSISKGINKAFVLDAVQKNRDSAVQSVLDKSAELGLFKSGQKVLFISKTPVGGEEYFPNVFEVIKV